MGSAVRPQRRAVLTGGLAAATAAFLTGCSSKTDGGATAETAFGRGGCAEGPLVTATGRGR
ncbi:hypothetical protein [Streptomyces vastus]|uniref:Uncharacterized protein n=1 Tax=Streptomyces vastus TaxID=285451 RepID=A0ABP6CFN4_9ACTN